jgi:hypothetical protein
MAITLLGALKGSAKSAVQGTLLSVFPGVPFWLKLTAVGFVVGAAYPLVRWVPGPLGRLGDALLGMLLMPLYFAGCFAVFGQPEVRGRPMSIWPLMGMSLVIGAIAGVITGEDFRKRKAPDAGAAGG